MSPAPVPVSVRAVVVTAWLVATGLLALAPTLYFAAGASDSASESARVAYAVIPLVAAWCVLTAGFSLLHRQRTGRWGLPFGRPAQRAAGLILLAVLMLAGARGLGDGGAIYGDGQWTMFWLTCLAAWGALGWRSARSDGHERA